MLLACVYFLLPITIAKLFRLLVLDSFLINTLAPFLHIQSTFFFLYTYVFFIFILERG